MNKTDCQNEILRNYPDFALESVAEIGEGMDSVAFLVNDSLIFRFPKDAEIRADLRKEICALPRLRPRLNLKIPEFEYLGADASFVGYRKIEGENLTKELFYSFSAPSQAAVQESLAEFLRTMHRQDIAEFIDCGIAVQDFRADYETDLENVRRHVFPLVSAETAEFVARRFRDYLDREENFADRPALLHNDLSPEHIFVDAETAEITGIIDFGDLGIGDPDYDLMYLLDDYGEDFVRAFLRFYPHPDHEELFGKLYFWGLVDTLQLIAHYRSEEENAAEIPGLLKYLADWIATMTKRL